MSAHEEVEGVMPWIATNAIAIEDELVERAVLVAITSPVPGVIAAQGAVLWLATGEIDRPVPLMTAWMNNFWDVRSHPSCGRCLSHRRSRHRLLISTHGSVVMLFCCDICRETLDGDDQDSTLHWENS